MLNLNDGAIGYLENDEENHRAFETISRALRPGGRNLVQLPNVLYARERLPQRSWIPASTMVELVEHRWNKREKRMEGLMVAVRFGEVLEDLDGIEFTPAPLHRRGAPRDLRLGRHGARPHLPRQRPAARPEAHPSSRSSPRVRKLP